MEVIRGKWSMDGCRTLADVAQRLRDGAARYEEMLQQGWELIGVIEDDYGYIRQTHSVP